MKILFIHPNMPGQYRNLCRVAAQDKRNTVVFLTKPTKVEIPGVHKVEYQPARTASHMTAAATSVRPATTSQAVP